MKKTALTLTLIIFTALAFGQITKPDSTKKEYKNILEIDATALLHQFFYVSWTGGSYYGNTPYIISYKRIFKSNAFRFGVGGSLSNDNSTLNDTLHNRRKTNAFNVGIGIEHYCYLTKRWNYFFGIDAIASYTDNDYVQGNSATSSYKDREITYGYGVSPLIGVQFKINSRLSISTETSYDIINKIGDYKRTQTPNSSYDTDTKSHGIQSTFNAPININFRIHF